VREAATNVGLAIEKSLRGIEQANQEFLFGIFGDAQWSNKNKLSDKLLSDLKVAWQDGLKAEEKFKRILQDFVQ